MEKEFEEVELTPEISKQIGDTFVRVTTNIAAAASEYNEIGPELAHRFDGMFRTFLSLTKRSAEKDMTNNEVQIKVFEEMFEFSFEVEIEKRLKILLESPEFSQNVNKADEDINNADKELLANIKSNIKDYLKD